MLHRCKTYYVLEDYKIVVFKFGKRLVPLFYVPLYGSEDYRRHKEGQD